MFDCHVAVNRWGRYGFVGCCQLCWAQAVSHNWTPHVPVLRGGFCIFTFCSLSVVVMLVLTPPHYHQHVQDTLHNMLINLMCEMDRIFHCTIFTPNFSVVPASHKLPTLNFWCLSCEHPWALVRDNTVVLNLLCYDSHFISVPSCTKRCLVLHIISQVVIA